MVAHRPRGRHGRAGRPAAGARRRPARRHGRGPRRQRDHRGVAGLRRPRLRHRRRRGLDDDRRPPLRARQRRGAGDGRRHEPADPVRRGSDEPGVLRDDEPRRARAADGGGAARPSTTWSASSPRRPASSGTTCSTWSPWATRSCTTSCSASIPRRSGTAPFALATDLPVDARATDIAVGCRRARLHLLPCIAGHVGADAAGGHPRRGPASQRRRAAPRRRRHQRRDRARAAGAGCWPRRARPAPRFEGAQISCGQRATPGAIERVRIDRDTLEPRVSGRRQRRLVGRPRLRGEPARRRASPACAGPGSSRWSPSCSSSGVLDADGTIDGATADRTSTGSCPTVACSPTCCATRSGDRPALRITQNDVRAIQLAKAALQAGVRLLMDHAGLESLTDVGVGAAGRGLRQPHRPAVRAGPRSAPGLPAGPRACRPATRPAPARCGRCCPREARARDRPGRPHGDEGRDGHRAAVPGALRRLAGLPARHRSVPAPGPGGAAAGPPAGRPRGPGPAPPRRRTSRRTSQRSPT